MPVARRTLLRAGLAAAATLTGCAKSDSGAAWTTPTASGTAAVKPSGAAVEGLGGNPSSSVTPSSATPTGQTTCAAEVAKVLKRWLPATMQTFKHAGYPGAVALVMVKGATTVHTAVGEALRYGAGPTLLPARQWLPMRLDSIFDLASITKVYTVLDDM
jgi:CubicO group peptidase (beta-lactamase class C family)